MICFGCKQHIAFWYKPWIVFREHEILLQFHRRCKDSYIVGHERGESGERVKRFGKDPQPRLPRVVLPIHKVTPGGLVFRCIDCHRCFFKLAKVQGFEITCDHCGRVFRAANLGDFE